MASTLPRCHLNSRHEQLLAWQPPWPNLLPHLLLPRPCSTHITSHLCKPRVQPSRGPSGGAAPSLPQVVGHGYRGQLPLAAPPTLPPAPDTQPSVMGNHVFTVARVQTRLFNAVLEDPWNEAAAYHMSSQAGSSINPAPLSLPVPSTPQGAGKWGRG
ncbi:hypothetical protein Pmani_037184 [Petrolisthes manimaculis]|uniref:Uncharacterized protein n=1 Tax=Petrolisthes manimaculis TaxID=1843537 RepID=A0AAE1NHC0_9EUCA|nr:hypothetical protein Pmani_037184 [Petrolisthes manimaculis]